MGLAAAIGVGAVASVAGGIISSNGAKSAANASAAAADKSAQVQQQIYGENKQTLAPYVAAGLPATGMINNALGLGTDTPASVNWAGYLDNTPEALAAYNAQANQQAAYANNPFLQKYYQGTGQAAPTALDKGAFAQQWYQQHGNGASLAPYTTPGQTAADKASAAFGLFRNSTGYDFRLQQGYNALNSGYAGAGTIKSGAAMKAAENYGQGMASQEFGNWLNALGTQQGVGLNAAGAQAGVATNYANSLGNIYQQNGANQANAALSSANSIAGGIGGAGSLASMLIGYKSGILK